MSVVGLVLAAGAGRRFGMPKALVRYRGTLFVEHAAEVLHDGGCTTVVVVLGAAATEVRATAVLNGSSLVDNPDWATGMGSSLRVGLAALPPADAVVIMPVDTPGVTAAAVRRLAALASPNALARATYDGAPGHPVLIGRERWADVRAAAVGDAGARDYLARHKTRSVPCADVASGADVDVPAELSYPGGMVWRMDVEEWLNSCAPDARERAERLASLVHAADPGIEAAIKWRRLTFTVGGDWHHWLCAVAVTSRGVNLMFHKGALLADPSRLLRGEGKYLRQVAYERATGSPEAVTELVQAAVAHQTDMLD